MKFFEKLQCGDAKPEDVDDYIDAWHGDEYNEAPIDEYLGMTNEQYKKFVEDASSINKYYNIDKDKMPWMLTLLFLVGYVFALDTIPYMMLEILPIGVVVERIGRILVSSSAIITLIFTYSHEYVRYKWYT
tara:strand:+ start:3123 stop:3515 length:393 start_codon:yes stop_codon:yes gene_type:complete